MCPDRERIVRWLGLSGYLFHGATGRLMRRLGSSPAVSRTERWVAPSIWRGRCAENVLAVHPVLDREHSLELQQLHYPAYAPSRPDQHYLGVGKIVPGSHEQAGSGPVHELELREVDEEPARWLGNHGGEEIIELVRAGEIELAAQAQGRDARPEADGGAGQRSDLRYLAPVVSFGAVSASSAVCEPSGPDGSQGRVGRSCQVVGLLVEVDGGQGSSVRAVALRDYGTGGATTSPDATPLLGRLSGSAILLHRPPNGLDGKNFRSAGLSARTDNEDGAMSVVRYLRADRAEQESGEAAPTSGAHDDELGVLGRVQDGA